jgi:hypothetical protein
MRVRKCLPCGKEHTEDYEFWQCEHEALWTLVEELENNELDDPLREVRDEEQGP